MAEGFATALGGAGVRVASAGVKAGGVHPKAIEVMRELDIDISHHTSKTVDKFEGDDFDIIITLCDPAREYCITPSISKPSKRKDEEYARKSALFLGNPVYLHWTIDDPAIVKGKDEKILAAFRGARDALRGEVERLIDGGYIEALSSQRRHLEKLVDLLDDGIAIHDQNRRFYIFNRAAEKLTGHSKQEVIGMDCHDLFPPKGLCSGQCQFKNLKNPKPAKDRDYEVAFAANDGSEKRLTVTSAPIQIGFGKDAVLLTFRDVTELHQLRWNLEQRRSFHGMVGISPGMIEVFETIKSVSTSDYPVLIAGESGTGKELVSTAIHTESRRNGGPFVPVNCGALPENILESELFGHVRGAFTGAIREKKGRFELADGGTLFLDEVGELSQAFQVKLLRVLQEKRFERVGGEKTVEVDVRIIAATNQDLRQMVQEGRFREDLYYRLCVVPINLPPLRERPEDIPFLTDHVLDRIQEETDKKLLGLEQKAMDLLLRYNWPGNIRELINALQFASVRCTGKKIKKEHLPLDIQAQNLGNVGGTQIPPAVRTDPMRDLTLPNPVERAPSPDSMEPGNISLGKGSRKAKLNRENVGKAMVLAGGNKVKAAKLLNVGRATLYRFFKDNPVENQ
jgi:PAS domain S-box-containing protein